MSPGEVQVPDPAAGGSAGDIPEAGAEGVVEGTVAGGVWVVEV